MNAKALMKCKGRSHFSFFLFPFLFAFIPSLLQGASPPSPEGERFGLDFGAAGIVQGASPIQGLAPLPPGILAGTRPDTPLISFITFPYIGGRMKVGSGAQTFWLRLGATLGYDQISFSAKEEGITTTTVSASLFSFGLTPGFELPLVKAQRLTVSFVGFLPLGFSTLSSSVKTEVAQGNQTVITEVKTSISGFWFGLSPGVGASVELLENFYLGSEYRFLLVYSSLSQKNGNVSEFGFLPVNLNFLLSYRF